jgi:coenzyme F420 hydrogenase subunit beta
LSEADGRSLMIARTTVGRDLLRHAIGAGILAVDDLDVRAIDQIQPGQLARRRQLGVRISAYRLMGHRVPKYRRAALKQYSRGQSLVRKIVMFSATIRRLLRARR